MKEILILAGILVALAVLKKMVPFLVGRFLGGVVGRAIGSHALAQQPDTIHLEKCTTESWQDESAVQPLVSPLLQRGFHDAGVFRVREMAGLTLQLLVKSDESLVACVYEHPQAGHWVDLAARYQNGNSVTYTTSQPSGLEDRPGHPVHNAHGTDVGTLLGRMRSEMPKKPLQQVTPFTAPRIFEHAYAESMGYRRAKGVSAREVANVAERMKKAA